MRVLVWQWGRRGAGPRIAASLAAGLATLPGVDVSLSLAAGAEISRGPHAPVCDLPIETYQGMAGLAWRVARAPLLMRDVDAGLRRLRPNIAICAMIGPLDLFMLSALRRAGIADRVVIHDAEAHPGDGFPGQYFLQNALIRRASTLITLTHHVASRIRASHPQARTIVSGLPPVDYGVSTPANAHDGPRRALVFGRLLAYKGLDLLVDALHILGHRPDLEMRIVGLGPDSRVLSALRNLPGVTVENRWVPEHEVGTLLSWSDFLVLPYREASQSGVAAAAQACGRRMVATDVGGLREQLAGNVLATLCEPDAASLAAAIIQVLDAPADVPHAPTDSIGSWRNFAADVLGTLDNDGFGPAV